MKSVIVVFLSVIFLILLSCKIEKPKNQKPGNTVKYVKKIEDKKAGKTVKYAEKRKEQKGDKAVKRISEIKDQKLKKALKYVNEIIDSLRSIFQKKGELGELRKSYDSLFSIYRKKIEKNPTDIWSRLSFAYSLQKQFRFDKALFHYLTASIQSPETADPLIGLGRLFYTLAVLDMSKRKLTSQTESGFIRYHPDEKIKDILIAAKNLLLSAKRKKRLFRNGPKNIKIYIISPGTEDEFLEMIDHKLIEYWWQKGTEMEKKHKLEAALKCYSEASLIEPNSFPILFNKGSVLFKLNRFPDAINSFDKALDLRKFSDDVIIYREIARIHANGYHWPNDPRLIGFLEKDIENSKYKIRIGAVLLLNILSENNNTASVKLYEILKNNPKILDEIKKLKFRKTKD